MNSKNLHFRELISKREVWMALAIMWVMLFHSYLLFPVKGMYTFKDLGYGGVDFFLFASGIGCFYSLQKEEHIGHFLVRRAKRLLPLYECFLPVWFLFMYKTASITIPEMLGNIFCIQKFVGGEHFFNWYISEIWVLYLLAPYFFQLLKKISSYFSLLGILIVLLLASIPFWHTGFLVMAARVPVFFLGMYLGKRFATDDTISPKEIVVSLLLMLVGCVLLYLGTGPYKKLGIPYGIKWYPFLLIVPGMCLVISVIAGAWERTAIGRLVIKGLGFIGKHTFELFLVHILVFDSYKYLMATGRVGNTNLGWLISLIITVIACVFLYYGTQLVVWIWKRLFFKKCC